MSLNDTDAPAETPEELEAERVSGGQRVGLWKVLAISMVIVVIGFAVVAGFTSTGGG
jgi:hypothetical protein